MKIKGLAEVKKAVEKLEDEVQEKIDSIEWEGETPSEQAKDQQRDEYYNEGMNLLFEIKEKLDEIKELQLEDF